MELNSVDLNLLVALDALLAERSVTRAAHRLSVGQPAMSATLRRLRRLFDDELLVRDADRLTPTSLGESLRRPVREALEAAQRVLFVGNTFAPASDHRTFTIVASDYVGLVLLKPLVRRMAQLAPNIVLVLRPVGPGVLAQIRLEGIDLAIVPREIMPAHVELPSTDLFSDRFVIAVDESLPCELDDPAIPRLHDRRRVSTWDDALPGSSGWPPRTTGGTVAVELSTQTSLLAPFLVGGAQLTTPVLERLAAILGPVAGIRTIEPSKPLQSITEAMYWNARRTDDPSHRWLRGELEDVARGLDRIDTVDDPH